MLSLYHITGIQKSQWWGESTHHGTSVSKVKNLLPHIVTWVDIHICGSVLSFDVMCHISEEAIQNPNSKSV